MWPRTALALAALLLLSGAAMAPKPGVQSITVAGRLRSYEVERSGAAAPGQSVPLVIFLHGSREDVSQPIPARYDIPFAQIGGAGPLLIVRPQGVQGRWTYQDVPRRSWRQVLHWLLRRGDPPDDIAFLRALTARMVAEGADPRRIYVAGVSAGGYMAVRVACEMGGTVAAVAAVLATAHAAQLERCDGAPPVPILFLASTTDPAVSYAGWAASGALSAPATVDWFARHAGCTARTELALPHLAAEVPSTVDRVSYSGCQGGSEVVFYRVDGSGHSVPSLAAAEPGDWWANGGRNRDMETAAEVWRFFAAHSGGPGGQSRS